MNIKKPKSLLCNPALVICLRCGKQFKSQDRIRMRVCSNCRQRKT